MPLAYKFPANLRTPGSLGVFPPRDEALIGVPEPGRVGEWLKPADCKSAAPCGLRRFESSPVHHAEKARRRARCRETQGGFPKAIAEREGKPGERKARAEQLRVCRGGEKAARHRAWVAQTVERVLGKDEVTGSIPVPGSRIAGGCGGNSAVESRPSKPMVAGSNPVPRSKPAEGGTRKR